jgi:hypothetical protein
MILDDSELDAFIIKKVKEISEAKARHRAAVFEAFQVGMTTIINDTAITSQLGLSPDLVRYIQLYLKMLSTYPPESDRWLKVFNAFGSMLKKQLIRPDKAITRRPESVMEALRSNPRLTLLDNS